MPFYQFAEFERLAFSDIRRYNWFAPHDHQLATDGGAGGQCQFFKFTQWLFDLINLTVNLGDQNCPLDIVACEPAILYGFKQKRRPSAVMDY